MEIYQVIENYIVDSEVKSITISHHSTQPNAQSKIQQLLDKEYRRTNDLDVLDNKISIRLLGGQYKTYPIYEIVTIKLED